jgi:hypothetical protein
MTNLREFVHDGIHRGCLYVQPGETFLGFAPILENSAYKNNVFNTPASSFFVSNKK